MRLILILWLITGGIALSLALSSHLGAYKITAPPASFLRADSFTTEHFLGGSCECSKNVLKHLLRRGPIETANERIYLIGGSQDQLASLKSRGFDAQLIEEEKALVEMHVEAVPFMRIESLGKILYGGAYGPDQKHNQTYEDESIIRTALAGSSSSSRPTFGCINGLKRKKQFDFWGFKYGI